jgi:hypothetical protein
MTYYPSLIGHKNINIKISKSVNMLKVIKTKYQLHLYLSRKYTNLKNCYYPVHVKNL